jgi:polyisoprenyl-phosphate glycosyltransferase
MTTRIAVVTPVFDDWASFGVLLRELSNQFSGAGLDLVVTAVDDGSTGPIELSEVAVPENSCVHEITVVSLALNLGHQRAIAVGLTEIAGREDIDAVVVMDCDGEDRPEDLPALLSAGRQHPGQIVLARRAKRSETRIFKTGYWIYKLLFRLLTGRRIDFGNFSLLPMACVRRLVHMPELWNNLAAAILRSRLKCIEVPTQRGCRYAGVSKMNFVSLSVHGLTAMSVYTDAIFVRVLLSAVSVATLTLLGIATAVLIRFSTGLAIPGWTTNVVGALLIMLMQTIVLVVATTLTLLAGRSSRPIVPKIDAPAFIASKTRRQIAHRVPEPVLVATA